MKILDIEPKYITRPIAKKICNNKYLLRKYLLKYDLIGGSLLSVKPPIVKRKCKMLDTQFIDLVGKIFKKYNIIQLNKDIYEKHKSVSRCSWEKDSKSLRQKYEKTISKCKDDILCKNYFNKALCNLDVLNVVTDGGLISAIRGSGYLTSKRAIRDDMDIDFACYIPDYIVKNRLIVIPSGIFDKGCIHFGKTCNNKKCSDICYRNKLEVLFLKYKLITKCNAVFNDRILKYQPNKPSIQCYINKFNRYCIGGRVLYNDMHVGLDLIINSQESFELNLKKFGPLRFASIEGQDCVIYEGAHKYASLKYGPTYMIPLNTTYHSGARSLVKAPFIDEWVKEWSNVDFLPEHASRLFWEKHTKKFVERDWTAPPLV